jgi:hypothetical protein
LLMAVISMGITLLMPNQTVKAVQYNVGCDEDKATRVNDLINAFDEVNASPTDDIIFLASNCVYTLTDVNNTTNGNNGLPVIGDNGTTTILGNQARIERSSEEGTPEFRLLTVENGAVTINDLTLKGGANTTSGGAILSISAALTLDMVTVLNNTSGYGGGIAVDSGTVTVLNSTVSYNTATSTTLGGAGFYINENGTLNVTNTTVSGNTASSTDSGGGGFYNLGTVLVTNSTFVDNSATENFGGGFYNTIGTVTLVNSVFHTNSALNQGGGFYNEAIVILTNVQITNNSASQGAGFYTTGVMSVSKGWIVSNTAAVGGGFSNGGTITLTNSTISNNTAADAGGGFYNEADVTLTNSTLMYNVSPSMGGGFYNLDSVQVTNSTFASNSASTGGGFYNVGTTTMSNTIVADSTAGGECFNITGSISGDFNLLESPCTFASGTSYLTHSIIADPALGSPTEEGALPLGDLSPAIDAGSNNDAIGATGLIDQAGNPRFVNDANVTDTGSGSAPIVDIGAIERQTNSSIPKISINDIELTEGNTGTVAFNFYVTLSNASGLTTTVSYVTGNGSASAPADYTAIPATTLTFTPGQTSKYITVLVNGDTIYEASETFVVDLSSPVNATFADNRGIGRITNNDSQPQISISDATMAEGNAGTIGYGFTVSLSAVSGVTTTVSYATANGSAIAPGDYTAIPAAVLTFKPGQTSKTITVLVNGDTAYESTETFVINLSSPVNATFADNRGIGRITNDDNPPQISINDVTLAEGNTGTTAFTFTLSLSAASGVTTSVSYVTGNGSASAPGDYTAHPLTTISFAPGQTVQQITVLVNGDALYETNETFVVDLSNPVNATFADNRGIGFITNDDAPPKLSITDRVLAEGNSGTTAFTFTVSLNAASSLMTTVNYFTGNGSAIAPGDYTAIASTLLSFNPGETSKQITVLVNGDTIVETNETFVVDLATPSNATFADNRGIGFITNDDGLPYIEEGLQIIPVAPELPQMQPVSPEVPAQPLPVPVEAAPLLPAGVVITDPVMFMWRAASGASVYSLQISTESGELVYEGTFSATVDCAGEICQALPDVALTSGATYLWSVQADDQPRSFGLLFSYTPVTFSPIVTP